MLSKETKDKIYNARSILVGQLPLPSDQIELITIALIYKFMDDIDEESRKLGGEVSFFRNGLGDYSWQKLLSNQLSGEERVLKFIHAIEAITKAPHIPELFKSIFRNTFLKFRDSRTLKLFLDEINKFKYEHSEELGNAFEYLLDSMGSQGENGQFRTPRNIIDFIVEVVDADKDDKILDPACGTAGFLISAYKHILRKYTKGYEDYRISLNNYEIEGISIHWGDKLKVTEKDKLTKRIEGYDITPLMVRLSQVNMYLHHFPNPLIHDYDTLSTKSRWDDKYDCIFANPPFMTPKGGVEPHEQFRIRASKAEILFSDYIIEHLRPNGKAGWIVPEGIIFQGSGDYVTLRKWLTENMGLWAVVSLPAGIFQPYSGVKTSILFVDRTLARLTDQIILVKVENDGFSLNTNRNPIKENDLPSALNLLVDYKKILPAVSSKSKESEQKVLEFSDKYKIKIKLLTRKEIAALDSYKAVSSAFDFCKREFRGFVRAKEKYEESYAKAEDEKQKQKALDTFHKNQKHFIEVTGFETIPFDEGMIKQWVNEKLKEEAVKYGKDRANVVRLSQELREYLDNEREYNLSIEKYNGILTTSLEHQMIPLGELGEVLDSIRKPIAERVREKGQYPYYGAMGIIDFIDDYLFDERLLLIAEDGGKWASGEKKAFIAEGKYWVNNHAHVIRINVDVAVDTFIMALLNTMNLNDYIGGAVVPKLTQESLRSILLPIPPLVIQQKIVDEIEGYQKVIDGCNLVIDNYKPSFQIDETWERVKLGEVCEFNYGIPLKETDRQGGEYPVYGSNGIVGYHNEFLVEAPFIVIGRKGTAGAVTYSEKNGTPIDTTFFIKLEDQSRVNQRFLYFLLNELNLDKVNIQSGVPGLNRNDAYNLDILLPTLYEQNIIVNKIEDELIVVDNCKKLKTQMEQKIKEVIDRVWGKNA